MIARHRPFRRAAPGLVIALAACGGGETASPAPDARPVEDARPPDGAPPVPVGGDARAPIADGRMPPDAGDLGAAGGDGARPPHDGHLGPDTALRPDAKSDAESDAALDTGLGGGDARVPLPDGHTPTDARAGEMGAGGAQPGDARPEPDDGGRRDGGDPAPDALPDPDGGAPAPDASGVCEPRAEVCNGRDDNCDGRIDERLNCDPAPSCRALKTADSFAPSDVYPIVGDAPDTLVDVYCDMETDGGGWTLIGASERQPLDDVGVPYYPDLVDLDPAGPNPGLWAGLAARFPAWDLRFACRDRLAPATAPFTVDVSFYGTDWYGEIAGGGPRDADTCFLDGNVPREDREPPARRNNRTGELLPRGTPFASGVLEGEDTCDDEGDFAVDFNDRGMDGNPADGTEWGEDDFVGRCGRDGVLDGQWFVFARERTLRETAPLRVDARVAVIGNPALAAGLQASLLRAEGLPGGPDAADRLVEGQYDVVVLSRVLSGGVEVTPRLVDTLDRFVRQGGGLVTELDGALPFLDGFAPGFPPPPGAPAPAGWFNGQMTGTARLGPNTPVSPIDPIDFLFRGIQGALRDPEGTEVFFGMAPPAGEALDLRVAANAPGGPPLIPQFGNAPAVLRGNHCGHAVIFAHFDWGDALGNPLSLVRDFAANLVDEASFLPPFDVPYTCPVYLPVPEAARTEILVCGPAGTDPAALLPAHFGLRRVEGCAPGPQTAVLFVTGRADVAALDGPSLRAWLSAGGRIVTAGGRGRAVHDLVFETDSPAGARTGECGGDILPAWRYEPGGRFWAEVPWAAPERVGCGEDLAGVAGLVPLGGWNPQTVSLAYRDLGEGRLYALETDFTEAGAGLSRKGRDLVRFLALGRPEGISFSGVRVGVPEDELLDGGFTPCLVTTYGSFEPIEALRAQCDGDVLVLGCRPAGETDLQVAAMGTRDEVFTEVGGAFDAAHPHNGVLWYLDPMSGWGFAPLNAGGVDRFPCDVLDPRAPDRLCWQATAGELNPGYRCGADVAFDATFERVIYMRNGRL